MQTQSPHPLSILVIGAGISGLATAISAALSGHTVTVLEAAKALQEVGAGLQVTPNATRILHRWGLDLDEAACEPTALSVHRYDGSVVLAHQADFDKAIRRAYGDAAPFVDMHRVDLQRALVARAAALGVTLRLGEAVEALDFEAGTATTRAGETVRGDVVVAADGVWSKCQAWFLGEGEARPPLPTGDLAYRVVLRLEDAGEDEELARWIREPTVHFWIGPGAHAVGYSMRAGQMYNVVLLVPDDLPEGVSRQPGNVEEMKALFADWDPFLMRFLDKVDAVEKWKLVHREELPSWVHETGNFVFVGDACHPMLPYLAQGANSAVEDGAVLGLLLGHVKSKDQIRKALKMYESLRKTRGERIARETFKQRRDFHMPDGPEQQARDELFLSMLGKEVKAPFPSRWTCPEVQPWLYGYDAFKEVEQAVANDPF